MFSECFQPVRIYRSRVQAPHHRPHQRKHPGLLTHSPAPVFHPRDSEFQPGNPACGAGWGRGSRCAWAPSACASPARNDCAALSEGVGGGCLPDGPSTGAGRALAEVHAPLGGPQWLLCVLVAQGPFLGYSRSRSRTGTDTRLPPGRLSAGVTSSREGCGVYAGPPWPGKCRLRPGPVIPRASGNRVCPILLTDVQITLSAGGRGIPGCCGGPGGTGALAGLT